MGDIYNGGMGNMDEKLFPLVTKHFLLQPQNTEKIWEEPWSVSLIKGEQKKVGSIHFEEAGFHGEVKIRVELENEYDKTGYDAEIFSTMAKFVFMFKDLREISTSCRHENDHRVRGLEKAGYVLREFKDGCDYYSMKKQKTSWTGLYIFVGLIAGFIIGITVSNLWMGTLSGILIGAVIGYLMDKKVEKEQM